MHSDRGRSDQPDQQRLSKPQATAHLQATAFIAEDQSYTPEESKQ